MADVKKDKNLDRLCAEYGYKFAVGVKKAFQDDAKKSEVLLIKSLGVLQEQGLYAFALFCKSRTGTEEKAGRKIGELTKDFLQKEPLSLIDESDLLKAIRKDGGLASDLEQLIFSIHLLEKALIYARYHAKALIKK